LGSSTVPRMVPRSWAMRFRAHPASVSTNVKRTRILFIIGFPLRLQRESVWRTCRRYNIKVLSCQVVSGGGVTTDGFRRSRVVLAGTVTYERRSPQLGGTLPGAPAVESDPELSPR